MEPDSSSASPILIFLHLELSIRSHSTFSILNNRTLDFIYQTISLLTFEFFRGHPTHLIHWLEGVIFHLPSNITYEKRGFYPFIMWKVTE